MQEFLPQLCEGMSKEKARQLNPLVLAFVGDAIQTLYVRTKVVNNNDCKAGQLHLMVSKEVKATNQSEVAKRLMPLFDEEEMAIFKRARNSKVHTSAKNASIGDYKTASGLEAVFGFLYLTANHERLKTFIEG